MKSFSRTALTPRWPLALAGLAAIAVAIGPCATAAEFLSPGARAFAPPGTAGVPRFGKSPKATFAFDRATPESSPWAAIPASDDIHACMPDVTVPPAEKVIARCVVGGKGALQNCELGKTRDPRMKVWAACILPKFQAKADYRGRDVEVPIQFTDQVAKQ